MTDAAGVGRVFKVLNDTHDAVKKVFEEEFTRLHELNKQLMAENSILQRDKVILADDVLSAESRAKKYTTECLQLHTEIADLKDRLAAPCENCRIFRQQIEQQQALFHVLMEQRDSSLTSLISKHLDGDCSKSGDVLKELSQALMTQRADDTACTEQVLNLPATAFASTKCDVSPNSIGAEKLRLKRRLNAKRNRYTAVEEQDKPQSKKPKTNIPLADQSPSAVSDVTNAKPPSPQPDSPPRYVIPETCFNNSESLLDDGDDDALLDTAHAPNLDVKQSESTATSGVSLKTCHSEKVTPEQNEAISPDKLQSDHVRAQHKANTTSTADNKENTELKRNVADVTDIKSSLASTVTEESCDIVCSSSSSSDDETPTAKQKSTSPSKTKLSAGQVRKSPEKQRKLRSGSKQNGLKPSNANSPITVSSGSQNSDAPIASKDVDVGEGVRSGANDKPRRTVDVRLRLEADIVVPNSPPSPVFEPQQQQMRTPQNSKRGSMVPAASASRTAEATDITEISDDDDQSSLLLLPVKRGALTTQHHKASSIVKPKLGYFASIDLKRLREKEAKRNDESTNHKQADEIEAATSQSPSVLKPTKVSSKALNDSKTKTTSTAATTKRYVPIEFVSDGESPSLLKDGKTSASTSTKRSTRSNQNEASNSSTAGEQHTKTLHSKSSKSNRLSMKTRGVQQQKRGKNTTSTTAQETMTSSAAATSDTWIRCGTTPKKQQHQQQKRTQQPQQQLGALEFSRHPGSSQARPSERRLLQTKLSADAFTRKRPTSRQLAQLYNGEQHLELDTQADESLLEQARQASLKELSRPPDDQVDLDLHSHDLEAEVENSDMDDDLLRTMTGPRYTSTPANPRLRNIGRQEYARLATLNSSVTDASQEDADVNQVDLDENEVKVDQVDVDQSEAVALPTAYNDTLDPRVRLSLYDQTAGAAPCSSSTEANHNNNNEATSEQQQYPVTSTATEQLRPVTSPSKPSRMTRHRVKVLAERAEELTSQQQQPQQQQQQQQQELEYSEQSAVFDRAAAPVRVTASTSHAVPDQSPQQRCQPPQTSKPQTRDSVLDNSFDRVPSKQPDVGYKYVEVVRKKDERRRLEPHVCSECNAYFGALDLSPDEMARRMQACRHRARYAPPGTPEHFWSLTVPSTQECVERGYLQVAEVGDATPKPRRRRPLRKLNAPAKDIMAAAATDAAAAGNRDESGSGNGDGSRDDDSGGADDNDT